MFDELTGKDSCLSCSDTIFSSSRHLFWSKVKNRFKSRYGINLTSKIYADIINKVNEGQSVCLKGGTTKQRNVHKVKVLDRDVFVVVHHGKRGLNKEGFIVTALPDTPYIKVRENGLEFSMRVKSYSNSRKPRKKTKANKSESYIN
ncbi:hypothetical protein KJB35_04650 [Vibrio sp. D431a]|nr:hypothetical protein [Vibrio sp. D431a]